MVKYFLKSVAGTAFFFIFLFGAAGSWRYDVGWIYVAVSVFGLLMNAIAKRKNEALAQERSKPGSNVASWDKKILGLLAVVTIIAYVVAGLDSGRFEWSPVFGTWVILVGIALTVAGQIIFTAAKYQNHFFSSVARIQCDRNHAVCDQGLYKVVRHPGYMGMIMSWVGFPFILQLVYSAIPVLLAIILLIIRTFLEDRLLAAQLPGYPAYAQKTKYRIVPMIW